MIAVIGFLVWGFSGVLLGWVLSWVCFLTIPLYYTLVDAIYKRKPSHFAYPLLVVIVYMFFGFLDTCGGWSFGWIAFLTIPIYYEICKLFKSERKVLTIKTELKTYKNTAVFYQLPCLILL